MLYKILFVVIILLSVRFVMNLFRAVKVQNTSPNRGNIHVDNNPNQEKKNYDGGEYIDYEEVK